MATRGATWRHKMIILGWIGAIALAWLYVSRPAKAPPPPAGWEVWEKTGPVRALVMTEHGVYAGGLRGLFLLSEDGTSESVTIAGVKDPVIVNALMLDKNGVLWVGHGQGVSILTASGWRTLDEADGLPHQRVATIVATRDEHVWLGTTRGAVRMPLAGPWDKTTMQRLSTESGLLHDTVWAIIEDSEGGLWFGNYAAPAGGLSRLKAGAWSHWTTKNGLPHPNVTSLLMTNEGRVWAGCGFFDRGGAAIFGSASGAWRLEHVVPTEELAGPKVRSLHQDRAGRMWLGSEFNGLTIRDRDRTVRILTPDDGLPAWEVMSIMQGRNGAIWLGTYGGVVRISPRAVDSLLAQGTEVQVGGAP